MKIYFAGSIRGGRDDQEVYSVIIQELKKHGPVLTEHVGEGTLTDQGEVVTDIDIFTRDIGRISEADVVVAEVTTPSLGVGYEIGRAESMKKPVLCLYRKQDGKRLSAMISGNPYLKVVEYKTIEDLVEILDKFLA